MARVKSAVTKRKRHKKILKQAKGYFGHKHIGFRSAKEQVRKSNEYAFRDRKHVKREMRKLWIKRINAASRYYEMSYSQFMNGLKKAKIEINRKMLADIAVHDLEQFGHLVNEAKIALGQKPIEVKPIPKEEKVVKKVSKPARQKTEEVNENISKPVKEKTEEVNENISKPVQLKLEFEEEEVTSTQTQKNESSVETKQPFNEFKKKIEISKVVSMLKEPTKNGQKNKNEVIQKPILTNFKPNVKDFADNSIVNPERTQEQILEEIKKESVPKKEKPE